MLCLAALSESRSPQKELVFSLSPLPLFPLPYSLYPISFTLFPLPSPLPNSISLLAMNFQNWWDKRRFMP